MSAVGWPETASQASAYGEEAKERVGFFTDTSICIGCKACEVACKEWNLVPEDGLVWTGESYDNTSELGANSWRHVAFIEQNEPLRLEDEGKEDVLRWLMSSDVCKHCTHAACLDVCPTGSLFRTEYGTVVVQEDIFGPLDELRERADRRLEKLQTEGWNGAQLYGRDPGDGVGGFGAFFLLLDEPEVYGLPPDPVVTTRDLPGMWRNAAIAAGALVVGIAAAFAGGSE